MSNTKIVSLLLLRITIGWFMLYAGVSKLMDPSWSAASYLHGAKTFTAFYNWLATPAVLPLVNFINAWGLTLLGVSLLLGISIRLSATLGAILMLMYYFPILNGLQPNAHAFVVDQHLIYASALLVLAFMDAGNTWGLKHVVMQWNVVKHSTLLQWLVA